MAKAKASSKPKLNEHLPDTIKEKHYVTRQVDTSISILESPENDVVLESLLFLSKYADIKLSNLTYLQQKGITLKLLTLLDRNICILRLALRLLGVLIEHTPVICELDQDIYDDKIVEIADLLTHHQDTLVKEFCIYVCSKLAQSCRITSLIFKTDLFAPVLDIIQNSYNSNLIITTMNFLNYLLDSPAALGNLIAYPNFHVSAITVHIYNDNEDIVEKAYHLIKKLTSKDITGYQVMFREDKLMEKMMDVLMNPNQKNQHRDASQIMQNCANSEATGSYYIKTLQFLSFCLWVRTCDDEYLLPCADIFEKLTAIPSEKQVLYDLSVEDSILCLLRSNDKNVLNKVCKSITNMSVHRYCCEDMLTPTLVSTLVEILKRKNDDVDPGNEVALETIYSFLSRTPKSISMFYDNNVIPLLLKCFIKDTTLSEESYLRIAEVLYKYSMISEYQEDVISEAFFEKLLALIRGDSEDLAALSLEISIHFIGNKNFNALFRSTNGAKMILEKLQKTTDKKLMKFLLLFIHNSMLVDDLEILFIKSEMVPALKNLPQSVLYRAPIVDRILKLAYDVHLPLKFYETGKLNLTDKLGNKFYVAREKLYGPLPLIELIEAQKVCLLSMFYVVDYTCKVKRTSEETETTGHGKTTNDLFFAEDLCSLMQSPFYGEIPPDPYLPRYIKHVEVMTPPECTLQEKIHSLAVYVDEILCGPVENDTMSGKMHNFKLHLESLKYKLGTNLIPIGYLRIGFLCERALLFKAIADRVNIPCTLERRNFAVYWNEVAILERSEKECFLKFYVVDLINDIGSLLSVGSREANKYLKYSS